MSNNVEHFDYIGDGRLYIRRGEARCLLAIYDHNEMAEGNWLDRLEDDGHLDGDKEANLLIESPWWYGERSGSEFDFLIEKLLPATTGYAQLYFVFESGELAGYEVNDGVVTEKDVKVTLE